MQLTTTLAYRDSRLIAVTDLRISTDLGGGGGGGGGESFIKSRLNFMEESDLKSPDFECQWFLIKPNRQLYYTCNCLPPPGNVDNKLRTIGTFHCLDKALSNHSNSGILVGGYFHQCKPGHLCSSFKLENIVTKATRRKKYSAPGVLHTITQLRRS